MDSVSSVSGHDIEQREALMDDEADTTHNKADAQVFEDSTTSEKAGSISRAATSDFSGWPAGPTKLRKHGRLHWLWTVCVILMMLLPALFLFLSIVALLLDGKERSQFGEHLVEAGKYGTTAFPIIFTAVVSRMNRALALKWSERGAKIGTLEQLIGSQSLGTTVERFFEIRRYDLLSLLLILIWCLSPIGSQLTLRLLDLKDSQERATGQARYIDLDHVLGSNFASNQAAISPLVGASLLSSTEAQLLPADQWGNVRVPQLSSSVSPSHVNAEGWTSAEDSKTWASLSGLVIEGFSSHARHTNFTANTSYIEVSCPDSFRVDVKDRNITASLLGAGLSLRFHNISDPWNVSKTGSNTAFLDTLSPLEGIYANTLPRSLVYVSTAGGGYSYYSPKDANHPELPSNYFEVFNCSAAFIGLQVQVSCRDGSCATVRARPNDRTYVETVDVGQRNTFIYVLNQIPEIVGTPFAENVGPSDQLLMGPQNPFSEESDQPYVQNYSMVSGSLFGSRLTTIMNTVWQAGLCPRGTVLGINANVSACGRTSKTGGILLTNTTTLTVIPQSVYVTSKWHAIFLLLISLFLQVAAIATTMLMTFTDAPRIFGYVSSLTRDNEHVAIPSGGSALDGADRSRYLSSVRVRLEDIRPDAEVGHISFCTVDDQDKSSRGQLREGRLYD